MLCFAAFTGRCPGQSGCLLRMAHSSRRTARDWHWAGSLVLRRAKTEQCCGMDRMGPRTKSFKGSAVDSVDSTSQAWLAAWHSLPEVISAATPLVTSEALDGTGGIYVLKPPRWLNSYSWTDAAAYPVYIFWAILAVWIPLSWAGLVFRVFFTLESIW